MAEIGRTLREARMHAHIDVSEIEEQTKIRAKYLRALENEEWTLLPGGSYTKAFIRVYAQTLGLDGRALVDEYKAAFEHPGEADRHDVVRRGGARSTRRGQGAEGPPKLSRWYVATLVGLCALIAVVAVALLSSSGSKTATAGGAETVAGNVGHSRHHGRGHRQTQGRGSGTATAATGQGAGGQAVTLSLRATSKVWVCLLGEGGQRLIGGTVLSPEERATVFHARTFKLNLGNAHVELLIDGRLEPVRESSRAIGYSITSAGRTPLPPGHLPTCA